MPPKLDIEVARAAAAKRGGICLSVEYKSGKDKLQWQCRKGHQWDATLEQVRRGQWCPSCAGRPRITLETCQEKAAEYGGECLSESYKNNYSPLRWKCAEDHEWDAGWRNIQKGHWCPHCSGNARGSIETARDIARRRGGQCLSTEYKNNKARLRWQCVRKHQWEAPLDMIKNEGTWCPECASNAKVTAEMLEEIARQRGGRCDTSNFTTVVKHIRWWCAEEHTWLAIPSEVKNSGTWCPTCGGRERDTIENMHTIASERGGRCLSTSYKNQNIKLTWACEFGHEWEALPLNVKRGSWCPNCRFKNEQECRNIIERLTGRKFPKRKPKWLDGLELDGYCEEIEIGFEYQGEQHTQIVEPWHRNGKTDLEAQQERDAVKAASCDDHSTDLVVIDFDVEDKLGFITKELCDIYRKRYAAVKAAILIRKIVSPVFVIANNDRIWRELGL